MKFAIASVSLVLTVPSLAFAQGVVGSARTAPAPNGVPATAPAPSPAVASGTTPNQEGAQGCAPTYLVENGALFLVDGATTTPVVVEGPVSSAKVHDGKLYLTHRNTIVSVYTCAEPGAPALLENLSTGRGVATSVEVVGDKVWVITVSEQALPIAELSKTGVSPSLPQTAPQVVATTSVTPEAPKVASSDIEIRVVEPGTVELLAGRKQKVRIGDRFAIYRETSVGNADSSFRGEELIALAEVVAVKEESALAALSRTAVVSKGDVARRAREEQTESNVYPVRVAHVGEVGGTLRPIVNAGTPLGVGVLAELYGSYWGNGYFANIMLQPLGLGWTDDGNIVSTSALIESGYDARAFSVGLGAGVSAINGNADAMLDDVSWNQDYSGGTIVNRQTTHSAFTLSQLVRLGARDGLNLSVRNLLVLHEDSMNDQTGFIYGGTLGKLTLPLDRRNDLFIEGGGGVMGYWMVGAGVGTWLVGNGSPGSWKLSISAGAAGIWGSKEVTTTTSSGTSSYDRDVSIDGPMVSFGVTRRFGL